METLSSLVFLRHTNQCKVENGRREAKEIAKIQVIKGALYHAKEFRLYPKGLSSGVTYA